jgi:hypothetical protein
MRKAQRNKWRSYLWTSKYTVQKSVILDIHHISCSLTTIVISLSTIKFVIIFLLLLQYFFLFKIELTTDIDSNRLHNNNIKVNIEFRNGKWIVGLQGFANVMNCAIEENVYIHMYNDIYIDRMLLASEQKRDRPAVTFSETAFGCQRHLWIMTSRSLTICWCQVYGWDGGKYYRSELLYQQIFILQVKLKVWCICNFVTWQKFSLGLDVSSSFNGMWNLFDVPISKVLYIDYSWYPRRDKDVSPSRLLSTHFL